MGISSDSSDDSIARYVEDVCQLDALVAAMVLPPRCALLTHHHLRWLHVILSSYWLVLWLAHNVGLTLLNKMAFSKVHFPYPFMLSAVHMLCNWIGSFLCFWMLERHELFHTKQSPRRQSLRDDEEEQFLSDSNLDQETDGAEPDTKQKRHWLVRVLGDSIVRRKTLDRTAYRSILGFSIIFSLNIAIGNVSLKFVSVNFNQIMRSLVPALTIVMSYSLGKVVSNKRRNAVIPIIFGVRALTI